MKNEITVTNNNLPDLSKIPEKMLKISKESRETYKYAMKSFQNYCKNNGVEQNFDSMLAWIDSTRSQSTRTVYLAAIKSVLKTVYKFDPRLQQLLISIEETRQNYKKSFEITESKYLKKEEIDLLISKSPQHFGLMIEALFWTGCRISELINIELTKCELLNKKVYEIRIVGKGRKENIVYLEKKFFERCVKFFESKKFLFEHQGLKYERSYVSKAIVKLCRKHLDKKMSAHSLRHSKACYLRDVKNMSIDKIQKAMNHSSPVTTVSYYLHGRPTAEEQGIV